MSCCCVTDQRCTHPANVVRLRTPRTRCFACGQPVCKPCSRVIPWFRWGRRRVCDGCREVWRRELDELAMGLQD